MLADSQTLESLWKLTLADIVLSSDKAVWGQRTMGTAAHHRGAHWVAWLAAVILFRLGPWSDTRRKLAP